MLAVLVAYVARSYDSLLDFLPVVFAFVHAPLLATVLLGMFWKRSTGHGAFTGLVAGTLGAVVHHGVSLARGAIPGIKGGYFATMLTYPSELAQTFWTATAAFTTCLVVTIVVSMITRPRPDEELKGCLLYTSPSPRDRTRSRMPSSA